MRKRFFYLQSMMIGVLAGCVPASSPSAPETLDDQEQPWTRCYEGFQPTTDAPSDLQRLTSACGPSTGLEAVTPVYRGSPQAEGDLAERLLFRAHEGRCYRFFSIGIASVKDLDMAVYGPEGQLVAADGSHDRFPVVPPRGPLCVNQEGVYTVAVGVMQGQGAYLMQVWAKELDGPTKRQ